MAKIIDLDLEKEDWELYFVDKKDFCKLTPSQKKKYLKLKEFKKRAKEFCDFILENKELLDFAVDRYGDFYQNLLYYIIYEG